MWVDEIIFSKGELSASVNGDIYSESIEYYFSGNYQERLEHVEQMIDRLQAEKTMLLDYFADSTE